MTRSHFLKTLVLGAVLAAAAPATEPALSSAEREKALKYLAASRDGLTKALKGITEEQWAFKPNPNRWSIAEIVEHIAIVEGMVHGLFGQLATAPAPPADFDAKAVDARILAAMPDRTQKAEAPPSVQPTAKLSGPEAQRQFLSIRDQVAAAVKTRQDLRAHVLPHPFFGPMDGYQWALAAAGHADRHTKQILEVKADPNFPR